VSLDSSSGGRRDAAQEDDTDFYSGGGNIVAAGSSLQNGVAAAVVTSSSSYSEALTPVTNKVSFIYFTEWTSFTCFYFRLWKVEDRDLNIFLNSDLGPGLTESCLDLNQDPALKLKICIGSVPRLV
jgi:hypothetical protein